MTLMDRYILRMYLRVLVICAVSFCGMFIVADAFNNLDEFIGYGRDQAGGVLGVVWDYYRPRALTILDMAGGLLALMAAVFTVAWLQRSREMTALLAGGVPGIRIAAPMIGAAVAVAVLGMANRELWIPKFRDSLTRNAQNWRGDQPRPVEATYDYVTNIYLDGQEAFLDERRIASPNFRLPRSLRHIGRKLVGENAYCLEATDEHPSGFLVDGVEQPRQLTTQPSISVQGKPAILTPVDAKWLKPNQCFVVSDVDFQLLSSAEAWRQYSSASELVEALHNPSLDYGAGVRVAIHTRLVHPLLEVLLVLIGLPLVMTRRNQNVFAAVGKCFLLVLVFTAVVMGSQQAGAAYLLRPALAAWLPVIILSPTAVFLMHSLWE